MQKTSNKAFTLVELIVVITILSILGTISFISLQGYSETAKNSAKLTDLSNIDKTINIAALRGEGFNVSGLTPITYAAYPKDVKVYVGHLGNTTIPGLLKAPLDPFTGKPYIVGVYARSESNSSMYAQVGTVMENKYGDVPLVFINQTHANTTYAPAGVPMQKIVGNYKPNDIRGISGLIPRWALEDYEEFQTTDFYTSGEKMYGTTWGHFNNYIFGMDGVPVVQVEGYTNTGTLLYESFENQKIEIITASRLYNDEYIKYPYCNSNSISMSISHEHNSVYVDFLQTTKCNIDENSGVNSKSSLYINWLRDSAGGDGEYNYITFNPDKKYKYSLDVKGHLDSTVSGGKLRLYFRCQTLDLSGARTYVGVKAFKVNLDPVNFSRISAYVNEPDPSGNGLSIDIPGGTTDSTSCIFYRANAPKGGDELWFDNYVVEEIN